jgi:pimeloyl-ACP methyl ester carboxylesterase
VAVGFEEWQVMVPSVPRRWSWRLVFGALAAAGVGIQEYASRNYYSRTPDPEHFLYEDERTAWTPIWRESFALSEWIRLQLSPIYRSTDIPRGDEAPVILVHGFLTRGVYLRPLQNWLARIGYCPQIAELGWGADCLATLTGQLVETVQRTRDQSARHVHLVGHSLGGLLSRAAAAAAPDAVASVVTLSGPIRGLRIHPVLRAAASVVRDSIHRRRGSSVRSGCFTLACECTTVRSLASPLPPELPQLAIVTAHDGLTDWRYCRDPATMRVVRVSASHFGLVFNPTVYEVLADHLRSAGGGSRHTEQRGRR